VFVLEDAPEFARDLPQEEWAAERDPGRIAQMLNESAKAVRDAVRSRVEEGRDMDLHPEEVYECLESQGYLSLSAQSDRGGVIALIESTVRAFPSNPGFDDDLGWDVQAALERAGFLSEKGLTEGCAT
jgi:hypothetical protein